MAGWKRIVRGMVGTGLVFGIGSATVALGVGVAAMIFGNANLQDLRFAGRIGAVGFILGTGFSAILALAARNRRFTQLSFPKFAVIGASAGLAYFLLLATNAWSVWSLQTAILNLVLLLLMGSGAATATLLVARRARAESVMANELGTVEALIELSEGSADTSFVSNATTPKQSVHNP